MNVSVAPPALEAVEILSGRRITGIEFERSADVGQRFVELGGLRERSAQIAVRRW